MTTSTNQPNVLIISARRFARLSIAGTLLCVLLLANAPAARAAVIVWTGAGPDSNWQTPTNWAGAIAPTNGDDVAFTGNVRLICTNNIAGLKLDSIGFNASDFSLSGNFIVLTNGINDNLGFNTNAIPLVLAANQSFSNQVSGSTNLISGNITNSGFNLTIGGLGYEVISGVISGGGGLTMNGGDTLRLNGANLFSNNLAVVSGNLVLGNAAAIPSGNGRGNVSLASGTLLDLNGNNQTVNGLTGSGTVDNRAGTATYTLTIGGSTNSGSTFDGIIQNSSGVIALTKTGTNTITLTASHTYTGNTAINGGGTLALGGAGSIGFTTNITIASGSVFDISASSFQFGNSVQPQILIAGRTSGFTNDIVGTLTENSCIINPIPGVPATLTISGGLTLNNGTLNYDLSTVTNAGGGSNDLIAINGPLSLSGVITVKVNPLSGSFSPNPYTLISGGTSLASGSAANFTTDAPRGLTTTFDTSTRPGSVFVTLTGFPTPGTLVWSGVNGGVWDVQQSQNWLNNGSPDYFYFLDNVVFDDTAATATVNLNVGVTPSSVTFDNSSSNYVVTGGGAITGPGGLTINGLGTVTLSTANSYTGPTVVNHGSLYLGTTGASPNNAIYGGVTPGQLVLGGGGVFQADTANVTYIASLTNLVLNPGAASFCERARQSSSTYQFQIGTITRNVGATIDFNNIQQKAASPQCGVMITNPAVNGIVGGYAVIFEANWVAPATTGVGANSYAAYQTTNNPTVWGAVSNVSLTANPSANLNNTAINSLKLAGATVTINPGFALTLASGGLLVPTGGGASAINGGTLQGALNADLIAQNYSAGTFTIGSTIADNTNGSVTVGSALTVAGQGTVVLTGNNTYSGVTYVNGGTLGLTGSSAATPNANFPGSTLQIGSGGTSGSIVTSSSVVDSGNLAFNRSDVVTFSAPISGFGAVKQIGAGTTILAANNSYSGPTLISAGTLQVGNGGTVGALGNSSGITDNSKLVFDRSDSISYSGPISGTGSLLKIGSGTVTLGGTNSYVGVTTISNGTLALGASGFISNSAAIVVNGGAVLDVSSAGNLNLSGGTIQQVLAGTGTVNGSVTTASGSTTGTRITPGTNGVYGTLTINHALSWSGGVVNFDVSSSSSDLLVVGGNLALNSGTLQLNVTGTLPLGRYKVIQYGGTLSGSVGNIALNGFDQVGAVPSLDSSVAGEIDLVITAYTPVNLTWQGNGVNNFWDVLTTADWTNSLGVATTFHQGDNTTFDDTSTNTTVNLQGALTPNQVSVNGTINSYTLQGSGSLAGGSLTNNNPNTLTILTTQAGNTTINAGTVQIGNGTVAGALGGGAVVNNSALIFNEPATEIAGGPISGPGTVTLASATTLELVANSTYTGPTTINAGGVLQIGAGSASGSLGTGTVNNSGAIVFDNTGIVTNGGGISGSGSLTNISTGTLVLGGANSYAGDTVIANGVLKLGASEVIPDGPGLGNVDLDGGNTVAGTLDLNGFNETINGLSGVLGTVLGQVVNNGGIGTNTLTIGNGDTNSTFAGLIEDNNGAGGKVAIVKIGAGTLTLQPGGVGNNYSGGTTIDDGFVSGGSSTTANPIMCGAGPVIFGTNGTLQLGGFTGSTSPDYGTFGNAVIVPSNMTATVYGTCRGGGFAPSSVTGPTNSTMALITRYVRGNFAGNWANYNGLVIVSNITASANTDFRLNTAGGFPNARVYLAAGQVGGVFMYNLVTGTPHIPIGELSGDASASISLNTGSASGVVAVWVVGALNTSAEYDGAITDTHGIVKVGTGAWTLTSGNLSYSGQTTVSNGVLVLSGSATLPNSTPIGISAPGKLDVSAAGTLSVGAAQTLQGNGTINGSLAFNGGGTLTVGFSNAIGTFTVTNSIDLSAGPTVQMELNRTDANGKNDLLAAGTTLTYGGTLDVTNIGPALHVGDTFKLFSAATLAGNFSAINLPTIDANNMAYTWSNNLSGAGTITVLTAVPAVNTTPTNITFTVSGMSLIMSWPADHTGWRLLAQTNAPGVGLTTNWFSVAGAASTNSVVFPIAPNGGTAFFRMVYP
jgi:fibronectin-binding autotransporter adhesin